MEIYEELTGSSDGYLNEHPERPSAQYKEAEKQALEEIKQLHDMSPRYSYTEECAAAILYRCEVKVRDEQVVYVETSGKKALIQRASEALHAEQYAESLYGDLGYRTLLTESVPFHVIFGVFSWMLIQDPTDPESRVVQFGARDAYGHARSKQPISAVLPSDFGTPGYGSRRADQIAAHISFLEEGDDNLNWLFDYWLEPSWGLRQYLWAHRDLDIEIAREIVASIPASATLKILEYLLGAYWDRYLGWPDLLAIRGQELLFVEVKSSKDKLSDDQKRWIEDNFGVLKFPFELLKLHRVTAQQSVAGVAPLAADRT
jgi:hypothetical protein